MKVLSVVGNRPQFIKSGPLSVALRDRGVDEVVVHTGQHYDRELSQVFFEELALPEPAHALGLRTSDPGVMGPRIAEIVAAERPGWVLVYGDTNSTLAGAVAAAEAAVPLAHVEAGLRSGDLSMPEERNRIEVDRLAQLLLAPDERSSRILADEGVSGRREVVGDVMADANHKLAPIARTRSRILEERGLEPGRYLVATVHREANVRPERLARIAGGLSRLPEPVLFPAHPRTRAALASNGLLLSPHVRVTDPLGYLDFAALASQARVVVTDSGGVQKEAYWYGVPCVTVRTTTEWVETVEAGWNRLIAADASAIVAAVSAAQLPLNHPPLYGDGHAADLIADVLCTIDRR
jgi:UDP-GlcNAc3NAcA epimerase